MVKGKPYDQVPKPVKRPPKPGETKVQADARRMLQRRGHRVDRVVKVEAAGTDGKNYAEVLFVRGRLAQRAIIDWPNGLTRPAAVTIVENWNL